MRIMLYKKIFLVVSYLLFFICLIISDIDNLIGAIIALASYSLGLYYCYAYIFKMDIDFHISALTLEDKYSRICIFLCGVSLIFSILLSLSGCVEIFDFDVVITT
jgi:hypothetical protein